MSTLKLNVPEGVLKMYQVINIRDFKELKNFLCVSKIYAIYVRCDFLQNQYDYLMAEWEWYCEEASDKILITYLLFIKIKHILSITFRNIAEFLKGQIVPRSRFGLLIISIWVSDFSVYYHRFKQPYLPHNHCWGRGSKQCCFTYLRNGSRCGWTSSEIVIKNKVASGWLGKKLIMSCQHNKVIMYRKKNWSAEYIYQQSLKNFLRQCQRCNVVCEYVEWIPKAQPRFYAHIESTDVFIGLAHL